MEHAAETKSEYDNGVVYAMASAGSAYWGAPPTTVASV